MLKRISSDLPFTEAASIWLESRCFQSERGASSARYIRDTTARSYRAYIESLNLFFGNLKLTQIHLGHLRAYQEARDAGAPPFIRYRRPQDARQRKLKDGRVLPPKGKTPCPASPKKVNQELGTLKMILRRAGCWTDEMDEFYEPFREDTAEIPRALSPEDQERWLRVSAQEDRWRLVHWYSQLAFATGLGTNEMRFLRRVDVDLTQELVTVQPLGAKNKYRVRSVPLVTEASRWAAECLMRRAHEFGSRDLTHYVFPFCTGRARGKWSEGEPISVYDPTRPMSNTGMKHLWEEVRLASGLTNFSPYHTRHTAITRWAEAGMPIAQVMELSGHMTVRMMRHYARISDSALRKSLRQALGGDQKKRPPARETAHYYNLPKAGNGWF